MTRIRFLFLPGVAALALTAAGCPSSFSYPSTPVGRYCRHTIDVCGERLLTPAECVTTFDNQAAMLPAACQALNAAELDCQASAACTGDVCAAEHQATNDCLASAGMGGGI